MQAITRKLGNARCIPITLQPASNYSRTWTTADFCHAAASYCEITRDTARYRRPNFSAERTYATIYGEGLTAIQIAVTRPTSRFRSVRFPTSLPFNPFAQRQKSLFFFAVLSTCIERIEGTEDSFSSGNRPVCTIFRLLVISFIRPTQLPTFIFFFFHYINR